MPTRDQQGRRRPRRTGTAPRGQFALFAAGFALLAAHWPLAPAVADDDRPGYRGEARNPFAPTEAILRERGSGRSGVRFERAEGAFKVPKMHLRGIVTGSGGQVAALLEIDGHGTHIVREGDTIGLYERDSDLVVRIGRIQRLHVEVEAGALRQVIIVR